VHHHVRPGAFFHRSFVCKIIINIILYYIMHTDNSTKYGRNHWTIRKPTCARGPRSESNRCTDHRLYNYIVSLPAVYYTCQLDLITIVFGGVVLITCVQFSLDRFALFRVLLSKLIPFPSRDTLFFGIRVGINNNVRTVYDYTHNVRNAPNTRRVTKMPRDCCIIVLAR